VFALPNRRAYGSLDREVLTMHGDGKQGRRGHSGVLRPLARGGCLGALLLCATCVRATPPNSVVMPAAMPTAARPAASSEPATAGADATCPLDDLSVGAEYLNATDHVALQLRTSEPHVAALRERLLPMTEATDATGAIVVGPAAYGFPHSVRARAIDAGVQLTFVPERSGDLASLRSAIQEDVLAMQRGDCTRFANLLPR
jgi:hypothetical protein